MPVVLRTLTEELRSGTFGAGGRISYKLRTRDEHFQDGGPKRILCLDGGGLRGILSLQFLKRIEEILRERHGGDAGFRLAHYFDLCAGTSTGAIIAAALAKGLTVTEIERDYLNMGQTIFKGGRFLGGIVGARYDKDALSTLLRDVLGDNTTLGSTDLLTGVLLVTKRVDTGSPWPLGNNPNGHYFRAKPTDKWLSNADYPLWQVVRASTAAPTYFDPEMLTIGAGDKAFHGEFVDGGVSPFNNPALQAFMYATLSGYRVGWKTGAERMLIVSIGTGTGDPSITHSNFAAAAGIKALGGLMDDCASLVETMMQWMSSSSTRRVIDRELGDLSADTLCGAPLFTYQRYNALLTTEGLSKVLPDVTDEVMESLAKMDKPENMKILQKVGLDAARHIEPTHFPHSFDLGG